MSRGPASTTTGSAGRSRGAWAPIGALAWGLLGAACGDASAPTPGAAGSSAAAAPTRGTEEPAARSPEGTRAGDPLEALGLTALAPEPRADWPTERPHITSTFGWRINPITGVGQKLHRGLDLRGQTGDLALAIADGEVAFVGHDPFLGRCVILDHGGGITSWYGHLNDPLVSEGSRVARGAAIGVIGNTGRSQAPHLHLTVKIGGTAIDPLWVLGLPLFPYPALVADPAAADGEGDDAS
ncbi:MAG: M23 family metallopeptidase [Nannocystaceae bacterium]